MEYILAIDQGTTGTTSLLMDTDLNRIAEANVDFEQHFPKPGQVEHDLDDIWSSVLQTVREVTKRIDLRKIQAIGITNQRETICFWDRVTTEPIARAIVWQDRRTTEICDKLRAQGLESYFQDTTGLILDPYFSGTKVAWAFEHWPHIQAAYRSGKLAVGNIDSFLVAKLSGGGVHATEPSNASRTLCFNLNKHAFDPDLCKALGIPSDIWPELCPSVGTFALTKGLNVLPDGIPITGILGDQQAALLGQACIREGSAKCTYGTGTFLLLNTGRKPVKSKHRLVTTVAWALSSRPEDYTYALEGSAFIAGAAVQWVKDGLKFIENSREIETLANSVQSSEGVIFVPALTGLGAPYWDPNATGMITGITRGTKQGHIARAVLEGIAYQNADILQAMQLDLGKSLTHLNVDGGASSNDLLMQIQSDILGVELRRPAYRETTSLGSVFAAGLGAGIWTDLLDIEKTWKKERLFLPEINEKERAQLLKKWHLAIAQATYHG